MTQMFLNYHQRNLKIFLYDLGSFFTGPLCFKIPSNVSKVRFNPSNPIYFFQVQLIFSVPENYDQNPHIYSFFYLVLPHRRVQMVYDPSHEIMK